MDIKLCKRVSKFKMADSESPVRGIPKSILILEKFIVFFGRIVLKCLDMIDMDIKFCNRIS